MSALDLMQVVGSLCILIGYALLTSGWVRPGAWLSLVGTGALALWAAAIGAWPVMLLQFAFAAINANVLRKRGL